MEKNKQIYPLIITKYPPYLFTTEMQYISGLQGFSFMKPIWMQCFYIPFFKLFQQTV